MTAHPYFVRRRSRASGYWRPCNSRAWSASRVGTISSFFRAGRRLYRSWTVYQCWCSTSTVDSFSFLIFVFVCHAYPAFVLHPILVFTKNPKVCSLVLGFVFRFCSPFVRALRHVPAWFLLFFCVFLLVFFFLLDCWKRERS